MSKKIFGGGLKKKQRRAFPNDKKKNFFFRRSNDVFTLHLNKKIEKTGVIWWIRDGGYGILHSFSGEKKKKKTTSNNYTQNQNLSKNHTHDTTSRNCCAV